MRTNWREIRSLVAKGIFATATVAATAFYGCSENRQPATQTETEAPATDANTIESNDNALRNDTAMPMGTDTANGNSLGTENTRGMSEMGTTHGTGSAGTTYGGSTDTSNNRSGKARQTGVQDGNNH